MASYKGYALKLGHMDDLGHHWVHYDVACGGIVSCVHEHAQTRIGPLRQSGLVSVPVHVKTWKSAWGNVVRRHVEPVKHVRVCLLQLGLYMAQVLGPRGAWVQGAYVGVCRYPPTYILLGLTSFFVLSPIGSWHVSPSCVALWCLTTYCSMLRCGQSGSVPCQQGTHRS